MWSYVFILPDVHRQLRMQRPKPEKTLSCDEDNLFFSRQLVVSKPTCCDIKRINCSLRKINQKEILASVSEERCKGAKEKKSFSYAYEWPLNGGSL